MSRKEDDLEDIVARMFGVRFPRPDGDSGEPDPEPIPVEAVEVDDSDDPDAAEAPSPSGGGAHDAANGGGRDKRPGSGKRRGRGSKRRRRGAGASRVAAIDSLAGWNRRRLVTLALVLVLLLIFCYWWFHPAINLRSEQVWGWIILVALVAIGGLAVAARRSVAHGGAFRKLMALPVAVIVVYVVGQLMGLALIPGNAERYASVLDTTDGTFAEDIEEVDYSSVPVIDRDSAALLGNRAMGSIPEYVSQFEISPAYSQINYQGRPVRVSPLVYADLFKWFSNRDQGIPAYVLVDMVTQEAEIVELPEGIKFSESEPLARNIDRYAQLAYPSYMFAEKSFELDEDGNPWWVFPVQRKTIGLFDGTTIDRVVLVNACTGETQDYAIEDCPTWVDRAYPSDLIIEQCNWSGAYKNGWLNSWLGQEGVVHVSSGTDGLQGYNYIAQGEDIYLYAGVTSVTADNSNVGFILVNQRTGESHYYSVAGATEDSAMASAEGQVQDLGYHATYPLLLNIAGQPTYFISLKDDAGLVKSYAMINVEQYQSVAMGDTVAECQDAYLSMLASGGVLGEEDAEQAGGSEQASGTIATMAQAVVDGNSHFYVTLEGDGSIYDFALPSMLPIVRYKVGDAISFGYTPGDEVMTATSIE